MPPITGPSATVDIAEELLECIRLKLVEYDLPLPCRICVVPGEIVYDNCSDGGQLYATIVDSYYSNVFPIDVSTDVTFSSSCAPGMAAANITFSLIRCAPGPKGNPPRPPTCEEYRASALSIGKDNYAMRAGVLCCLADMKRTRQIVDFRMGRAVTAGPEGGCVGTVMTLTLAFIDA